MDIKMFLSKRDYLLAKKLLEFFKSEQLEIELNGVWPSALKAAFFRLQVDLEVQRTSGFFYSGIVAINNIQCTIEGSAYLGTCVLKKQ